MNLKYNTWKNRVHLEVMKCRIEKTLDDFMWLWYMYIVMENYNDFDTIYVLILSMLRLSSLQYPPVLWIIIHTLYVWLTPLILIYNVAHLNVNLYFSRLYFSNNLCFSLTNNKNSFIWSYRPHFVFWFYKHYESGLQSMSVYYTCLLFLAKTI